MLAKTKDVAELKVKQEGTRRWLGKELLSVMGRLSFTHHGHRYQKKQKLGMSHTIYLRYDYWNSNGLVS